MKLFTLILAFSLTVLCSSRAQTTRTVNNLPGSQAQYATINAAITAASPGDIILVQGSGISYGDVSLSKRVAIIGTGYFLGHNGTNTQATGSIAQFGDVAFYAGSEGSIFTGFSFNNLVAATSNVVVSRCLFNYMYVSGTTVGNFTVKQCFMNYFDGRGGSFIIKNNIISRSYVCYQNSGEFMNNIVLPVAYEFSLSGNTIIRNNIFLGDYVTISNLNNLTRNIFSGNYLGYVGGGNLVNVAYGGTSLFVGYPTQGDNSPDGRFKLSSASPARGAGVNGVDCGAFGGDEPYVLSGIPFIPNIYELTVPNAGSSGSGIKITIKAKSNN